MKGSMGVIRGLAVMGLLFGTATLSQAQTLWYNGDFNGVNGLANEIDGAVNGSQVYDDFIVPVGQTWNITSVFSNNLTDLAIRTANWEIRSGVSAGNGGTLVASGSGAATVTPTGRNGFGYTEENVSVATGALTLTAGTYWLNVTPVSPDSGRSFLSTTSGANSVGLPAGNNDNSFWTSGFFGQNFAPASGGVGTPVDFSEGIMGTTGIAATPEPGAYALFASLGVAGSTLLRRRRTIR